MEGPDQTVHFHSLIKAFNAQIWNKNTFPKMQQ